MHCHPERSIAICLVNRNAKSRDLLSFKCERTLLSAALDSDRSIKKHPECFFGVH
jgi:hypothetical protein